ncbi:histidine triad nucleotide-binding protein 3-like [Hippocampus comes]|uniref:Histidine triad nucleotide-binding protein 3-like n=1 Tax=Hippocampus comes TaxID=109280 RepID=A0A3Q2XNZ5_HIPCM|nr:PREDICTED: histidine triad nucleotide-binding protein 3-like [Hippocampus comes]
MTTSGERRRVSFREFQFRVWFGHASTISGCRRTQPPPTCSVIDCSSRERTPHRRRAPPNLPKATRMASHDDSCPFCQIAKGQSDTEILQSDEELVCFRDVKPAAEHHYLVIPRTYIGNCDDLRAQHIPMVERMAEMGRGVLVKNKVRDPKDIRLGFHVPPFCSVPHLHLHALAPASKMSELTQRKYGSVSHWFITVDDALTRLRTRGRIR